jgi:hypothetical protein
MIASNYHPKRHVSSLDYIQIMCHDNPVTGVRTPIICTKPVVLYENLFIVAACVLKKIENGAVGVGHSTGLCRKKIYL